MIFFEFIVGEDDVDRRIDRVTRKFLKTTPLSVIYKNIRSGFIRVNGLKIKNDYRVQKNDVVFIEKNFYNKNTSAVSIEREKDSLPCLDIEVVFENEHVKVFNKPYGMLAQGANNGEVSLDAFVKDEYLQKQKMGKHKNSLSFLPGPLHRIDKYTTGLLVFSQSLKGAQYVSEAISSRFVKKQYICVLSGSLKNDCIWEHYIEKDNPTLDNGFVTVQAREGKVDRAKYAKTIVTPLAHGVYFGEDITLAKVSIETGRTHQIRSQASSSKYPLLGDSAYGYKGKSRTFFLHAWMLFFPDDNPLNIPEKLIANLPLSFKDFVKQHLPNFTIPSYN